MFSGVFEGISLPDWATDIAGILALIWIGIIVYRHWSNFHENEFVRKRLLRLEEAEKAEDLSEEERRFLANSKQVERLVMTTKIKCTPNGAKLVHKLYNTGEFPIAVLKPSLPYLTQVDGKVKAHMPKLETVVAWISLATAIFSFGYGVYLIFALKTFGGDINNLAAGSMSFVLYAALAVWTGREYRTKRDFDWAVDKLKEIGLYYEGSTTEASTKPITTPSDKAA